MVDLEDLLTKTSRTFALSIPLLPEPLYSEVRLAYLLFRIADTFEDSTEWSQERRIAALERFAVLLEGPPEEGSLEALARRWTEDPPCAHDGYLELLAATPGVMAAFYDLDEAARERIRHHTARTCHGMAVYVHRTDAQGRLRLTDLEDLKGYCYVVAGIVGEMLTDLFLLRDPALASSAEFLRQRARAFGEALQLVNILKDSSDDAVEGRSYLHGVERSRVFRLAREDLGTASEYCRRLQEAGGERGTVAFCTLPVLLAWGTLERVETQGPGAKLTRPEVASLAEGLDRALSEGRPVIPEGFERAPIPEPA